MERGACGMGNVYVKALSSMVAVMVCMGALLFLPAWPLDYWQAWAFLALYTAAGLVILSVDCPCRPISASPPTSSS